MKSQNQRAQVSQVALAQPVSVIRTVRDGQRLAQAGQERSPEAPADPPPTLLKQEAAASVPHVIKSEVGKSDLSRLRVKKILKFVFFRISHSRMVRKL